MFHNLFLKMLLVVLVLLGLPSYLGLENTFALTLSRWSLTLSGDFISRGLQKQSPE